MTIQPLRPPVIFFLYQGTARMAWRLSVSMVTSISWFQKNTTFLAKQHLVHPRNFWRLGLLDQFQTFLDKICTFQTHSTIFRRIFPSKPDWELKTSKFLLVSFEGFFRPNRIIPTRRAHTIVVFMELWGPHKLPHRWVTGDISPLNQWSYHPTYNWFLGPSCIPLPEIRIWTTVIT